MTEIKWWQRKNVCGVIAKGHAGFNPGNDIVCSAVSALLQILYAGLDIKCDAKVEHRQEDGYFEIQAEYYDGNRMAVEAVFGTVIVGLELIAQGHSDHVRVERVGW